MELDTATVGAIAAALTFTATMITNKINSRGGADTRRDARIATLEAQLDKANTALADARERHMAAVERLIDEEEALRDKHADTVAELRGRLDDARVQLMALRAELLRRGVNPDRLTGERVQVAA